MATQPQKTDPVGGSPMQVLRLAIEAVPAVKYALGVAGITAVVAIVAGFQIDYRIAVFGTIIVLGLMFGLVVFARTSTAAAGSFHLPGLFMTWAFVVLICATAFLLLTCAFFSWPESLPELAGITQPPPPPDDARGEKIREALKGYQITDISVTDRLLWILALRPTDGPVLRNLDGSTYPTKEAALFRIGADATPNVYKFSRLPFDNGTISVDGGEVRVFLNYKQETQYAYGGAIYYFDGDRLSEKAVVPQFDGRNWGFFPQFIGKQIKYFSFDGYRWVVDNTADGNVSPSDAEADFKRYLASKSQGMLPESDRQRLIGRIIDVVYRL